MSKKLPVLFIAHGSPMNALEHNDYTEAIKALAQKIDRPKAIMVISAHWTTEGTYITSEDQPKTIYDFYGFPEELYNIKYSPKGAEKYSKIALESLASENVKGTTSWGLDHGSWTVLKHMYPDADIPVFQMSLNVLLSEEQHYELGKKLASLREKGILIIGSGNIVHNLREVDFEENAKPADWAIDFDAHVAKAITDKKHLDLINYRSIFKSSKLSVPTDEHYLPLLYILAMQEENEKAQFVYKGILNRSLSMRSVIINS